ncbi:hypothetical protein [Haloarcula salina]|nr:hypothetical protein [Haloarcula salina]
MGITSRVNRGLRRFSRFLRDSIGDEMRGFFASYVWVVLGLFLFSAGSIISPFYAPERVSGIVFSHAALIAAIAFHLFSVGNSVSAIAVSIKSREMLDKGTEIAGNATIVAIAAGILFMTGYGWNIPWQSLPISPYIAWMSLKWNAAIMIGISQLFLFIGLFLHMPLHKWYQEVADRLERNWTLQ